MGTVDRSVWYQARYSTFDTRRTPQTVTFSKAVKIARSRTGSSQPRWKDLIWHHQQAGTNLSGTYESVSGSLFTCAKAVYDVNIPGSNKTRWYKISGDLNLHRYTITFTGGDLTGNTAEKQATMRAYKQIRAATRVFTGGVFLGELRETLRMLRKPLAGLQDGLGSYLKALARKETAAKAATRFRKGEKRKAERAAQKAAQDRIKSSASQLWLEGMFGWIPLISDIEDATEAYEKLAKENNKDQFEKIRAVGTYECNVSNTDDVYAPIANLTVRTSVRESQRAIFIIRGEVRIRPQMALADTAGRLGFSLRDFIPTAWELLPWSFLVDYFADVGGYLDASTTDTSGVTWLVGTSVKERIKYLVTKSHRSDQPDASTLLDHYSSLASSTIKRRTVGRVAPYPLASPTVLFRLPTAPLKLGNMLALWTQANSIHPQRFKFR